MDKESKIFIANDHAGFKLKMFLIKNNPNHNWQDLGVFNEEVTSAYPEQAKMLCQKLSRLDETKQVEDLGVLICGSGQGMAMKANRFSHIRAGLAWDEQSAKLSREHNKANVLCLGARLISFNQAQSIFKAFVSAKFQGGRHIERVNQL